MNTLEHKLRFMCNSWEVRPASINILGINNISYGDIKKVTKLKQTMKMLADKELTNVLIFSNSQDLLKDLLKDFNKDSNQRVLQTDNATFWLLFDEFKADDIHYYIDKDIAYICSQYLDPPNAKIENIEDNLVNLFNLMSQEQEKIEVTGLDSLERKFINFSW